VLDIFKTRSLGRTTVVLFRFTVPPAVGYFSACVVASSTETLISPEERDRADVTAKLYAQAKTGTDIFIQCNRSV